MPWNFKALVGLVESRDGKAVADALRLHLESVAWKCYIASYHARQFDAILQAATDACPWISEGDHPGTRAAKLIFYWTVEDPSARAADFELEANLIAAAQSAHSVFDIFAHVLVRSFDIPRSKISGQIGAYTVRGAMAKGGIAPAVTDQLSRTIDGTAFKYLRAYVNTTKHQSLIRAQHSAQFSPRPDGGLRIRAFDYKPAKGPIETHPQRWAHDFLKSIDAMLGEVIRIGCEVNQALQIQSPGDAP